MDFQREDKLQEAICFHVRREYPDVVFTCEPSGIRLRPKQASMLARMRSGNKLPDMWILEPRGKYHGLILEIKTKKGTPYRKDGSIRKSEHVQGQAEVLQKLLKLGYQANFAVGWDNAIEQIDSYMNK